MSDLVYMRVSVDELSLPEVVAGSMYELERLCGVSRGAISSSMTRYKQGKQKYEKYIVVDISKICNVSEVGAEE